MRTQAPFTQIFPRLPQASTLPTLSRGGQQVELSRATATLFRPRSATVPAGQQQGRPRRLQCSRVRTAPEAALHLGALLPSSGEIAAQVSAAAGASSGSTGSRSTSRPGHSTSPRRWRPAGRRRPVRGSSSSARPCCSTCSRIPRGRRSTARISPCRRSDGPEGSSTVRSRSPPFPSSSLQSGRHRSGCPGSQRENGSMQQACLVLSFADTQGVCFLRMDGRDTRLHTCPRPVQSPGRTPAATRSSRNRTSVREGRLYTSADQDRTSVRASLRPPVPCAARRPESRSLRARRR